MSENKNEIFLSNLSIDIQYNSLREEILTRIKLRQQLLFFSLALASALLGFLEKLPIAAFLYPIFSTFVALSWIQNDNRIGELGSYIREYIENCKKDNKEDKIIVGLGWETHIIQTVQKIL
jgi:hypothetical protein